MRIIIFLYLFVFGCVYSLSAKQQPSTKDCVKHPQIVKAKVTTTTTVTEKPKVVANTLKTAKNSNTIPHFTIFNFFNFFYTKDTLDQLRVM